MAFSEDAHLESKECPVKASSADELLARMMRKRIRTLFAKHLLRICVLLAILGFLGFTNGFLTAWGKAFWIKSTTQLPLSYPGSIAVDSHGNIYVAADFYYRIHKYSPEGAFIKGWFSHDNNPRIKINEHDQLELANDNRSRMDDKPDTLTLYTLEGRLVSEEVLEGCYEQFSDKLDNCCKDRQGNVYAVRNKMWFPSIIKTDYSGVQTTIVKNPWYLWLIQGPLPAWLFFAVGLVGVGLLDRWVPA